LNSCFDANAVTFSATPINDLGSGLYLNQFRGGLYPGGSNTVPAAHESVGLARAAAIQPLNSAGQPDANGKYVLTSIGMSNTTQEFCSGNGTSCASYTFMGQAAASPAVDRSNLVIVDGAQGGQDAKVWTLPTDTTYDNVKQRLQGAGVTEAQVQALWLKQADAHPSVSLPNSNADAYTLEAELGQIARAAKARYPNLQIIFLSSRIYAGYATSDLNPEPYAYESGLAVKWLIEAQIQQMERGGGIDTRAGDLNYNNGTAPWLAWGPYLWADGMNPRSDGLTWVPSDFRTTDYTHPETPGRTKVGSMLLDFLLSSEFAQPWFLATTPGDLNGNGTVNAADYVTWRKTLGNSYTQNSYNTWRANFGQSGAASAQSSVPEPATVAVLAIAAAFLSLGERRK
jgi:hypothetical protein